MPYCSNCGTELNEGTKFCPECGTAVSRKRRMRQLSRFADTEPREQSTEDAVRRGMTNAKFNEEMSSVFVVEVLIVAIVIGVAASSWWWFGGTLLGLIALSSIPSIGTVICYVFGFAWGFIGYYIGTLFFGESAGWVIGAVAGLCGIGVNLAGRQYFEDLDDN